MPQEARQAWTARDIGAADRGALCGQCGSHNKICLDNGRVKEYIHGMTTAKSKAKTRVTPLFSFPLDTELKEQLDAVRANIGIPVAFQIRKGIEMFLATQPSAAKVAKAEKTTTKPSGRKR